MQENAKILLIDDEPDILVFLKFNLEKEGFKVEIAHSGEEGIALASTFKPNLIILDVMMPGVDGFETCIQLRKNKELDHTFIAFLTAGAGDDLQIKGFEAGADDYINKPIKINVFIKRVHALLRRESMKNNNPDKISLSGITIDFDRHTLIRDGKEIDITKKEFELLALLMSKPNQLFSRNNILEKLWNPETRISDRTIDVHIRKLREKIGEAHIKTIKGGGYKFEI
jgi:two-component system alkaline phosphatase synthesis response regulator PhoP